jgi:hypothetical protein
MALLDGVGSELDRASRCARPLEAKARDLQAECGRLHEQLAEHQRRLEMLGGELADARNHVHALLGSASWRITAPLRAVFRLVSGGS